MFWLDLIAILVWVAVLIAAIISAIKFRDF